LFYTLFNGTDIAALDAAFNLTNGSAVLPYSNSVAAGAPTTWYYMNMVGCSGGTTGDVLVGSSIYYPSFIRFNAPQTNRSYWYVNAQGNQISLNSGPTPVLVTTNVGACDVIFYGSAYAFAWRQGTTGSELIIDQENTAGSFYVNGTMSQKNALAGNMLTKRGAGRAVFNAWLVHTGPTRILEGELMVNGGNLASSVTTVNSGAILSGFGAIYGPVTNYSGGTIWSGSNGMGTLTITNNLILNTNSSLKFYAAALPTTNTTALLKITGGFTNYGTVNVSILAGRPALGQYPLISWTNAFSAAAFANFNLVTMPLRTLGYLSNNTANSSIDLVVTNINEPLKWATGSGTWDIATTANWQDTFGASTTYRETNGIGDSVLFEDTVSGVSPITVNLNVNPAPASVTFSNNLKSYTLSGNGGISGAIAVTKAGAGTLTLANTNLFTGGLNLNGGITTFTSLTNLGTGAISFGGGTLQYPSGDTEDLSTRTVTFNAGGATIDDNGNTITFAKPVGNSGAGGLTKVGAGSLTLTGTNKYSGNTVVAAGTLQLGYYTYLSNSAAIIVNSGASLDASLVGLTLAGSTVQTLAGAGTIAGTVTSSNGIITPGTNGVVGTLNFANDLVIAGGTVNLDLSTNSADLIAVTSGLSLYGGTIQLNVTGTLTNGVYKLMTYGALANGAVGNLQLSGYTQTGKSLTLYDTGSGEIDLVVGTMGGANIVWQGDNINNYWDIEISLGFTNSSGTAVTFVQGDNVLFNDTSANSTVQLNAAVQPGSVTVTANTQNYTFNDESGTGVGKLAGTCGITKNGSSSLTINTVNLNSGPTVINAGTIQVVGGLGTGNITNNGALVFNQNADGTVSGVISGTGSLTQSGGTLVTLATNNTYTGPTTISSGGLQVGTGGAAGSLGSGALTVGGALILNHTGTFTVGKLNGGTGTYGSLTFKGAANVTLTNGNTYGGSTTNNGGVVTLAAAEAIPSYATLSSSSGGLVLDGGATAGMLDLNGFNQTVNWLSGASGTVNGIITNSGTTGTNTLTVGTTTTTATTTYYGTIVENTNGAKTALTLRGSGSLRLYGNNTYSGGTTVGDTATLIYGNGATIGSGGQITLSNGTAFLMQASSSASAFPGNTLNVVSGATVSMGSLGSNTQGNSYGGNVVGDGTATFIITNSLSFGAQTKQFQTFTGLVQVASIGALRFANTSVLTNGGDNATFDVEGTINTRNGTGATGSQGISLGALTGAGTLSGAGNASGTTVYVIGSKGISSTFTGTISDGVDGIVDLIKTGAGTQTLSGTNTYSGFTTVSNGVLALSSSTGLSNSPTLTLSTNTSVIDVSGRSDATLTLGAATNQTLLGFGSVKGALVVGGGGFTGTLSPGATGTAGTLTVNGNATLNGGNTNLFDFNTTTTAGGGTNDLLQVNGNLTLNGIVYIQPTFLNGSPAIGVPYTIVKYTGTLTGDTNNLALLAANYAHMGAFFSTNTPGAITVTFGGTSNLVWVGDSTNSWQVGTVTNWNDGTGSNAFFQLDSVTFNDTASNFLVSVVGTNQPLSITVNATNNYTFTSSGKISGGSLTKSGTGTLLLTNTGVNVYSGDTVVSNGVLRIGTASALSTNSSLRVEGAGLVELAGTSPTVTGLSGSGAIDNVSTTLSILTVGSSSTGVWSGTITNGGTGGVSLIINDTNPFVISGVNRLNGATNTWVNNGTGPLIITNTGVVSLSQKEFWIGCESAVTGNVVVAGGSLVVSNWLVIGRDNTNANGTLVVNSGTVQKAGTNNIVVGSLGATGTLTVNGGQVLNNGMLYVGENAGANAVVNLNGGLLQATQVRTNGTTPNSSVINFNGGTLQATAASTDFIQGVTANVQNGGLVLDDGGFILSLVSQPLVASGTGGLTKQGAGTVYLDTTNTYTGTTTVSAGTLAGTGSVVSPVVVAAAGNLGAGLAGSSIGKLTINNSLTLQGNATFRLNKTGGVKTNDQIAASSVNYGGILVVTNITTDANVLAAGDTFTLFSAATHHGNFTSIVGSAGTGRGFTFTNGVLSVVTTVATNPTNITFSVSGSTLTLSWPADHLGWTLQQQTNSLSTGLGTNWTDVAGSTSINSTNITVDPAKPTVFYRLKL
jgi:autotransporter-associated beta strand protein